MLTGSGLTAINPAVLFYWLGAGSKLSEKAAIPAGSPAVWYAVAAATCGLCCWFTFISLLIRLRPQRVGPGFFRAVNSICGVVLTVFGVVLAAQALL